VDHDSAIWQIFLLSLCTGPQEECTQTGRDAKVNGLDITWNKLHGTLIANPVETEPLGELM
jgi:hypothetical protein